MVEYKIGIVLGLVAVLLEEVIDNPKINTKKYLLERVGELGALSDKELDAF